LLALSTLTTSPRAFAADYGVDPQSSRIGFIGRQAGADFEGQFRSFSGNIAFDQQNLDASRFDVSIDMQSVTTLEAQRDNMLKGADFFAVGRFPAAHFIASALTKTPDGKYTAVGRLQLRGVSHDLPVSFLWRDAGGGTAVIEGTAALKRLDFGVGQGDWQDTAWVENDVQVVFALHLTAAPAAR
jgi:polyisoprenoid-binding protein YceI